MTVDLDLLLALVLDVVVVKDLAAAVNCDCALVNMECEFGV